MPRATFIFLAYIVLEIYVLVQVAGAWGGWATLLLLGLSFLAGAFILQHSRTRILSGNPGSVAGLIFSSLAGVLLIIPGFVSDFIALLFLLPAVQAYLGKSSDKFFMRQGFNKLFRFGAFGNMNFSGSGFPNGEPQSGQEFSSEFGKEFRQEFRPDSRSGFNLDSRSGFTSRPSPESRPEFREDIKVTVIDREGGSTSQQTLSRRKKIDDSDIIDVDLDNK